MKKKLSVFLLIILLLSGCSSNKPKEIIYNEEIETLYGAEIKDIEAKEIKVSDFKKLMKEDDFFLIISKPSCPFFVELMGNLAQAENDMDIKEFYILNAEEFTKEEKEIVYGELGQPALPGIMVKKDGEYIYKDIGSLGIEDLISLSQEYSK